MYSRQFIVSSPSIILPYFFSLPRIKRGIKRGSHKRGLSLDPKFYAVAEPELLRTGARAVVSGFLKFSLSWVSSRVAGAGWVVATDD